MANEEDSKKFANSTMKRLSDAETEMLISFVQGRPCLWNESHADFKNMTLRRKMWNVVGGRLHITGDEAKCKWKNLKDKFRKLRNIQDVKADSGITPTAPTWKFYNAMLFTKDVLVSDLSNGTYSGVSNTAVSCVSLASDDSSSASSDVDEDAEDNDDLIEKPPKRESLSSKSPGPRVKRITTPPPMGGRGAKRKKNSNDSVKVLHVEEKKIGICSESQDDKKGDDYHFLMSLLPYIEALDPLEKLELRSGIQKLVADSYKKHVSKKGFRYRQPCGNQSEY